MKIGEVSSAVSYQGQGSSAKTAPAQNVSKDVKSADYSQPIIDDIKNSDNEYKGFNTNADDEKQGTSQATSSLKEAVSKINSANSNAEAVFGIHEGTNRVTIKMVDKETHEVIKEFPADKTLDLIAKAWELAGIMVDEKR